MQIRVRDLPILFLAFFGIVASYYLGFYLFNRVEFLSLDVVTALLLCIAYCFPVIYMNFIIIMLLQELKIKFAPKFNNLTSFFVYYLIVIAHQLYGVLMFCLIFYGENKNFKFINFRNNSWLFTASFLFLIFLIYIQTKYSRKKRFVLLRKIRSVDNEIEKPIKTE
jgi:hypothetical protein